MKEAKPKAPKKDKGLSVFDNNSVLKLDKIMQVDWIHKQNNKIGSLPNKFIDQIKKRGSLPVLQLIQQGFLKLEYKLPILSSESNKKGEKPDLLPLKTSIDRTKITVIEGQKNTKGEPHGIVRILSSAHGKFTLGEG